MANKSDDGDFPSSKTLIRRRVKSGHRSWGARGKPVPGSRKGDFLDAATRSRVMSRIRGKNTSPELLIAAELKMRGHWFEQHVRELPGCPDFVFQDARLAVFVDGDFWHGWRFPLWKHKLSDHWADKIAATRQRDQRNFRRLRRSGWTVLRIWEHQVERSPTVCADRIVEALAAAVCPP